MSFHLWISVVAAAIVLLLIPGPTVLQCIGDALANRRRQNWSTVLGVGAGDAVAMSLSLLGAGALLSTSAAAFTVMKTAGGCDLAYLGIRAIVNARRDDAPTLAPSTPEPPLTRFTKAGAITVLNPKSILFFIAFVPQFISQSADFATQAAILLVTFVALAMINAWAYMSLASYLSSRLQTRQARQRTGYASGVVLLAAGSLTLTLRRS